MFELQVSEGNGLEKMPSPLGPHKKCLIGGLPTIANPHKGHDLNYQSSQTMQGDWNTSLYIIIRNTLL